MNLQEMINISPYIQTIDTYNINESVALKSNQVIQGPCTITFQGNDYGLILENLTDVCLKNITINTGLYISNCTNVVIKNCKINSNTTGILIDNSKNIKINNCQITSLLDGIKVRQGNSFIKITNCSIESCGNQGIDIYPGGIYLHISGNTIQNNTNSGIVIKTGQFNEEMQTISKYINIINNQILNNGSFGVELVRSSTGDETVYPLASSINIGNNYISNNISHAVYCGAKDVTITSNFIYNHSTHGILCTTYSENININNNNISNNSLHGGYSGIRIHGKNILVQQNMFDGQNQAIGVGQKAYNVEIRDNLCLNCNTVRPIRVYDDTNYPPQNIVIDRVGTSAQVYDGSPGSKYRVGGLFYRKETGLPHDQFGWMFE